MKRRDLLFELALASGGSQALGLLRVLTPEEEERLAGVLRNTWRMDEATVRTFEKLTLQARRADDVSGPATLLPLVNGQRAAAEQPLRDGLHAALDLGDPTLIAFMHYWLGRMASDQNRTAAVFDHAFAIQSWANRSPSKLLAPLHETLFSLAYATEGNTAASARAHDNALASASAPKDNEPAFLYWVSPSEAELRRSTSLVQPDLS
ncbi:hypothetical protein ACTMTF_27995 [Nonomuraea sp. ZG12]|uniref:hypothetical protein n=1 Tax=Nonomuraea sp. ZG12 TaxID=3452207 RepID=UPI003F8BC8C6